MSPPDSLLSQKSVTQANKAVMHLSAAIPLGGGGVHFCSGMPKCRVVFFVEDTYHLLFETMSVEVRRVSPHFFK